MAEVMERHARSVSRPTKKAEAGLKKERTHTWAKPSPGKEWDTENKDPMTPPHNKGLKDKQQDVQMDQINPQATTNAWMTNKP